MKNGISVYAGMNCTIEENVALIETASSLGLKRMFTSLSIPEANESSDDFATILMTAISNEFEIILDVTPETISTFDFAVDIEQVTPRLDDGFNAMQISALSHVRKIILNASTINEELLINLTELEADFGNISALHNYYPQIYSALDIEYLKNQNELCHRFGIEVGAFVASKEGRRRPPMLEGLPTVEFTRNFSVEFSAKYLLALGVDFVMISDSLPTNEECKSIAEIKSDEIVFQIELLSDDEHVKEILSKTFKSRPEISSCLIRSSTRESTQEIYESTPQPRKIGDVTVNNVNYGRYMGEIQIVKTDLPADDRVNKIARILDNDLLLIDCLGSSKKFSFRF